MHVVSDTPYQGGWKLQSKERVQIVNGSGHVSAGGSAGVTLYFVKEGYYQKMIDFPLYDQEDTQSVIKRYAVPSPDPKVTRLGIVMEKQGTFTDLEENGASVQFDNNHAGSVFLLSLPLSKNVIPIKNLDDAAQLPPHAIFVTCPIETDNLLKSVLTRPGEDYLIAASISVQRAGPNDGFIKTLVTAGEGRPFQHFLRRAPADGYRDRIEFTSGELIDALMENKQTLCILFQKINGKYGHADINQVKSLTLTERPLLSTSIRNFNPMELPIWKPVSKGMNGTNTAN